MAKVSEAFPSKYLKAADLNERQIKLVIGNVQFENIGDDDKKPVLYFTKAKKGLVLNKTNARTIATAYGDEMNNWGGHEIILYSAMVQFRDEMVEAIRVRIAKTNPAPAPAPAPPLEHQDYKAENPAANIDDEIPF
jgi:hypothetical protein